jgi:transcriptional regulator with XRE-family HTH domain
MSSVAEAAARKFLPEPSTCRAIRQAAGLPLRSIADDLGVTRQAVFQWETGLRRPSGENLTRYLELLASLVELSETP